MMSPFLKENNPRINRAAGAFEKWVFTDRSLLQSNSFDVAFKPSVEYTDRINALGYFSLLGVLLAPAVAACSVGSRGAWGW